MPDTYGFNHLTYSGKAEVRCIEIGCEAGGSNSEWPKEKRKSHYLLHHGEEVKKAEEWQQRKAIIKERKVAIETFSQADLQWTVNEYGLRVQSCRMCKQEFSQERRRGRPNLECPACKKKLLEGATYGS